MGSAQGGGTRLTEAQRLDIIHELGRPDHRSRAAIAASYGVTPKAVRVLWANRAAVLDRCAGKTPAYLDATSCYHAPKHPALEILLHEWLARCRALRVTIPPSLALVQADVFARELRLSEAAFMATWGWLARFRRRHTVGRVLLHGEEGEVDKGDPVLLAALAALSRLVAGYAPSAIFNMDETGLFYRVLPRCTLLVSTEDPKDVRGRKVPKERVTAVICSNADGTLKVPITLIGKTLNPVYAIHKSWPLPYFQQPKAWLDGAIFTKWLPEVFVPAVEDLPHEKILLVVDNAPGHLDEVDIGRIKVRFMPPNCTSWRQPCDLGIIAAYKKRCKYLLMLKVLEFMEKTDYEKNRS